MPAAVAAAAAAAAAAAVAAAANDATTQSMLHGGRSVSSSEQLAPAVSAKLEDGHYITAACVAKKTDNAFNEQSPQPASQTFIHQGPWTAHHVCVVVSTLASRPRGLGFKS